MRTLPFAPCCLPHAPMTNASLTDRHQISSTFLSLNLAASCTKPGKCFAEHVGVNAPGSPKIAMRFLALRSSTLNAFGPMVQPGVSSSISSQRVPPGSLSPTLIAILSSSGLCFEVRQVNGYCNAEIYRVSRITTSYLARRFHASAASIADSPTGPSAPHEEQTPA